MNNKTKINFKNIKLSIYKVLIVIVIVVFGSFITNKNEIVKAKIYDKVYGSTISFAKIKKKYNNYAGSVIPFENIINEKEVFNEKIKYKDLGTFDNGIKLTLEDNYSVPIISDGIVIFIGNKDNLNKTVIIEDENGIDTYYGNLDSINVKLYDYVSKNDLLGNVHNNTLYLLFQKDGKYLDYKDFLK